MSTNEISRGDIERMARERGYTVEERQVPTYFPALGCTRQITFLAILDGNRVLAQFNQANLSRIKISNLLSRLDNPVEEKP